MAIDRLLTKILPQPFSKFAVINQKIEDAMRRRRTAIRNDEWAQKMNQIDQLLDYFQVLEAIVPAEGSQYISLYAARVLTPPNSAPNQGFELFKFIKDMHTIRNHIIHGRVGDVLSVKTDHKLDIPRFRHIIYSLASLYIMNGPLTYPLLVENALPPSSIAPENPLLPGVTAGSRNVRAPIPTIQVRL